MPGRAIIAAAAVSLLAALFASAAQATPSQLDLAGAANIRIQGAAFGDNAGESVGDAGDGNHDGIDDVILGSPRVRYAAPDGDGAQPCLQADPCSYQDAVLGVANDKPADGDEVVMAPGDYTVSGHINVPAAIHLHGAAGQPR